jgi:F-type H+-transporting ATPase subunit b
MAQAQAQTHSGTETAAEHHDVGFPPFATETFAGQLLWLAITFAILYTLLSRVVLPRLTGIIENRRALIAADLERAAALKVQAEEAGAAYEKSLSEAKARAQALAQEARETLSAQTDARRKALEADLAARLAASEATIAARKAEAMKSVRGIAAETAVAIVERITGRAPTAPTVEAALDQSKA